MSRLLATIFVVLPLGACGGDDDDDAAAEAPAAPSGLTGEVMGEGIHLRWTDNSYDEDEFVLERSDDGGAFSEVAREPFDTDQHHDAPLTAGVTYGYRVAADGAGGLSAYSAEVTLQMP